MIKNIKVCIYNTKLIQFFNLTLCFAVLSFPLSNLEKGIEGVR